MNIQIVSDSISTKQLDDIGREFYEDMVKGVVDVKKRIIAIGGEMHSDSEAVLLKAGSSQGDLWGFNILLDKDKDEFLVYESLINIRPRDNNRSMEVKNPEIRELMKQIILERILL